jgi:hypothetical protein
MMMKTKLTLLFLLTVFFLSAQNVKLDEETVYVNSIEFLKIDDDLSKDVIMKPNREIVFTIEDKFLNSVLPYRNDPRDPEQYNYPATATRAFYIVNFIDFDLKYETDVEKEEFFRILYKYNLFDAEGNVNQINAKRIGQLLSKEITGTIPVVTYPN